MNEKIFQGEFWERRSRNPNIICKKELFHRSTTHIFILLFISSLIVSCQHQNEKKTLRLMPGGSIPSKLFVLEIQPGMDWHERNMLTCFQGLVNKQDTRIYYVETKQDQFWLDYYEKEFNIPNEKISDINELLKRFSKEIDGYITYQPDNPHTLNIATTIGSLNNLLPVSPNFEALMKEVGLVKKEEAKDEELDRIDMYAKALKDLLPKCNQNLLAALCVHHPHWPTSTVQNKDYVMAHNIFSFDLSSSERDKSDYNLVREIYNSVNEGTIIIGWHCVRDKEHEAIGLSSEFGHLGMCSLNTPNLTVHSSIPLPKGKTFSQRTIDKEKLTVEDKVYIAYMATDGDAAWFMNNHVVNDWADPARGSLKYNWGFLPLAYDLMPGTVKYYMENTQPNDYFVAGPAGATYTYPYLHPEPTKYLKITDDYMNKCGLKTVHMTNWNDRDWWQEVEIPGFYDDLQTYLPNSIGFVRGMGESAFEKHELGEGKPYIFCGEGLHRGDDVYQTMKDFIDACPNRPLFIYNLVNHSIAMGEVKTAMDKFSTDDVESVHLDELLLLADKAFDEGKITAELYPDKSGIKEILIKDAKRSWLKLIDNLRKLNHESSGSENDYKKSVMNTPIGVEPIVAGDHLAFTTIWNSMTLVKLSLESKGIYVNHKPTALKQFLNEYNYINDVEVVSELQDLWNSWHHKSPSYYEAKQLSRRLIKVAYQIDKIIE
jgi:GxGYxYP putative glycoside hydrolase C-terminal domain/GxGYxYP_N 1st domain/GxGYxYP third domain/GxGYxYP_N second domain